MKKIKLGKTVSDKITGFKGVVTGKCSYLTGCDQYLVQPSSKEDNQKIEPVWFDVNRLKKHNHIKMIKLDTEKEKGCDLQAPKK